MTRTEAARVLGRLHEAQQQFYGGGPAERLHDVLAEDVVWTVPGNNAIAGTYRGFREVVDYFRRRRELAGCSLRLHPGDLLVGQGDVVARLTDGTATLAGIERRWSTVGLYRMRADLITACWLLPLDPEMFDRIWTVPGERE